MTVLKRFIPHISRQHVNAYDGKDLLQNNMSDPVSVYNYISTLWNVIKQQGGVVFSTVTSHLQGWGFGSRPWSVCLEIAHYPCASVSVLSSGYSSFPYSSVR